MTDLIAKIKKIFIESDEELFHRTHKNIQGKVIEAKKFSEIHNPKTRFIVAQEDGSLEYAALYGHVNSPKKGDIVEMWVHLYNSIFRESPFVQQETPDGYLESIQEEHRYMGIAKYKIIE